MLRHDKLLWKPWQSHEQDSTQCRNAERRCCGRRWELYKYVYVTGVWAYDHYGAWHAVSCCVNGH